MLVFSCLLLTHDYTVLYVTVHLNASQSAVKSRRLGSAARPATLSLLLTDECENLKMASGFKSIRPFIPQWEKKTKECNYMELSGPNVGLIRYCRTSLNQILKNEERGKGERRLK